MTYIPIDAHIGQGGMGTVYRATRLMIGDVVAVKIVNQEQSGASRADERSARALGLSAGAMALIGVLIADFFLFFR